MATYVTLNLIFILVACLAVGVRPRRPRRAIIATSLVLLALTAIFDNVIIGLSIVDYDPSKILGVYIGVAPIEDFMYTILALLIIPVLWKKLEATRAH